MRAFIPVPDKKTVNPKTWFDESDSANKLEKTKLSEMVTYFAFNWVKKLENYKALMTTTLVLIGFFCMKQESCITQMIPLLFVCEPDEVIDNKYKGKVQRFTRNCAESHMPSIVSISNKSIRLFPMRILHPSKINSYDKPGGNRTTYVDQDKITKDHTIPDMVTMPPIQGTVIIENK